MKHGRVLRDAAAYTLAGYLIQPLSIASSLIVRGEIGPYGTGVLSSLNLILFYVSFSHMGVLNAAERDLPYSLGNSDPARFKRISETTFSITMAAGLICALVVGVVGVVWRGRISRELSIGMELYAPYLVLWFWSAFYLTLLRTNQDFVFLSKVQLIVGVVSAVGAVVGVFTFGFRGVLASLLVGTLLQAILVTKRIGYVPAIRIDRRELKKLMLVGVPLLLLGLTMTGIRTLDNVLVLKFLGTEALGFYSIALLANTAVFQVTNSLSGVLYPGMQRAFGESQSFASIRRYVVRPSLVTAVIVPFLVAALVFAVPPAVGWLLPKFIPGLPAFRIIAVGTYWFAMFPMAANFMITLNKQLRLVMVLLLAMAIWTLFALLFHHLGWGLVGVALATCAGYAAAFAGTNALALRHWASWRETGRFLWDMSVPGLYAALLVAAIELLSPVPAGLVMQFVAAAVKFVIFCAAFVPLVYWMESRTLLYGEFLKPLMERVSTFRARHRSLAPE